MLMIAAIVLPLLAVLIFLADEVVRWASDAFMVLQGHARDGRPPE